jgi:serine/threonine-protein kinase
MAPEQLRNSRYARPTADLYAIGACLYQFLVGKSPYEGYGVQTGLEIVKLILNESPYPIEKLCSELPSPLIEIVNQALHRDLDRRFQSAKQMFRSLNSFAQLGGRSG